MNSHAVILFEWARPNYLFVALDALHRCSDIEQWDVWVFLDGGSNVSFAWVEQRFSFAHFVQYPVRRGNRGHVMASLIHAFDQGYEKVCYYDGDVILRTDTLTYLKSRNEEACFYSLFCNQHSRMVPSYCPLGNMITRAEFDPLRHWVETEQYVGRPCPQNATQRLTHGWWNYDDVFCAYTMAQNKCTWFADRHYSFHFGVRGMNSHLETNLEESMFCGAPDQWMSQILTVSKTSKSIAFTPKDFEYA